MNECDRARRRWRSAAAVLAVMMLPAAAASAQGTDSAAPIRVRVGPFFVTPTLTVRDIGVDTNVYNDDQTEPIKDFTFTVVPTFAATLGPRRVNVTLRSSNDLVYFAKQASERSVNGNYSASVGFAGKRVAPFADVGYLNTRERVSGEIDARARRVEWRGGTGVNFALTPKVSTSVRVGRSQVTFDRNAVFDNERLGQELDRVTRSASVSARYIVTPLMTVGVTTEVSRTRFDQDPLRDTRAVDTFFGIDLKPRALISGSARVGYQSFRPEMSTVPDFSGLVGSANVSYRARPSTLLGFSFDRNVEFSYLPAEPYYIREGFGVSLQRKFLPQWDVTVSGDRSWHRYRKVGFGQGEAAQGRSDRLLAAGLYLGYAVGRRTKISTGVYYQDRNSEFADRSYSGFRVGASVAYGF